MRGRPLDLGELVDLELRFAADRDVDARTLRERDEQIGRRILADGADVSRHELFRRWLGVLREGDGPSTGERIESWYRLIGAALAVLGFVAGAAAARAVLAYDGTHPVNLVHFLTVFVAAELALLALWLGAMIPALRSAGSRAGAPVYELIRHIVYRTARPSRLSPVLGRIGALGSVYGGVERWQLMALTQRTAVFFNVGALAACLYLIAFTDLAFAWSTTLQVDASTMASLLRALAMPWRWLGIAVPSTELVAASRYFRLGGRYDPQALKDWWAFLLAALITYGLLPRAVTWQLAAWRSRALRRWLPLDHGDCQVAYERLTRWRHGWGAQAAAPHGSAAAADASDGVEIRTSTARHSELPTGLRCTAVRWADVPLSDEEAAKLIEQGLGWRPSAVHACGGRDGTEDVERVVAELSREADRPLVLLAEAWEAPSRALSRFLAGVREAAGPRRNFVVALLGAHDGVWAAPAPEDLAIWQRVAAAAGDPYLRVQPLLAE